MTLQRDDPAAARLNPLRFKPFWLNLADGVLHLGCGPPGCGTILAVVLPATDVPLYIGFVSWDTRVAYRGMSISEPLPRGPPPAALTPPARSLLALSLAALRGTVAACNVCAIVTCLARRWGAAAPLWTVCISFIARHFSDVLQADAAAFCQLPARAIAHVYASGDLHAPELALFLGLESWTYGSPPLWALQAAADQAHAPAPPERCVSQLIADCADAAVCYVRFPLMLSAELERVQASPLVQAVPVLSRLLNEAHEHAAQLRTDSSQRTQSGASYCALEPPSSDAMALDSPRGSEQSDQSCLGVAMQRHTQAQDNHAQAHAAAHHQCDARASHATASTSASCEARASESPRAAHDGSASSNAAAPTAPSAPSPRLHRQCDLWRQWRTQWRCPPDVIELVHTHNSDQNGAMHFLGCSGGASGRFVNPHRVGKVEVTSSSPFNRDSDPSQLVSQGYHKMACALPCADGQTFWAVRFAAGRKLACLHYSMRANGTADFPMTWQLQGRDGADGAWAQLHAVPGGPSFVRPGQCLSWPVQQPPQPLFHSELRVLLDGPTSEGNRGLNVCHLELYGYLQGCVQG